MPIANKPAVRLLAQQLKLGMNRGANRISWQISLPGKGLPHAWGVADNGDSDQGKRCEKAVQALRLPFLRVGPCGRLFYGYHEQEPSTIENGTGTENKQHSARILSQ